MWNGQPLLLNATALADNGIVTVTLGQYPPQRLRNVTMYIAVLMAESGFVASWNNSMRARMVELHEAKKIFEGQCKRSVFLTSRYHLCGKTKGWKSEVVSMALSPWQPQIQHFSFDVLRLDGDRHFREDVRGGSVHITMAEPGAPAVWAVALQGCELNLVGERSQQTKTKWMFTLCRMKGSVPLDARLRPFARTSLRIAQVCRC